MYVVLLLHAVYTHPATRHAVLLLQWHARRMAAPRLLSVPLSCAPSFAFFISSTCTQSFTASCPRFICRSPDVATATGEYVVLGGAPLLG